MTAINGFKFPTHPTPADHSTPAAEPAAAYIKFDGVDGESQSAVIPPLRKFGQSAAEWMTLNHYIGHGADAD